MRIKLVIGFTLALVLGSVAVVLWARAQNGFSARDEPSAPEAFAARLMRSLSVPANAKQLKSPKPFDEAGLMGARMHWADHCAICHGNDGSGDTPMGRGLYPKPPDMRTSLTQAKSDGELFYIIENGIRLTGMPAWGTGEGHGDESWQLVGFIRTLPKLTKEDVQQIQSMNPKSAHEAMEDADEEEFLRGNPTAQPE